MPERQPRTAEISESTMALLFHQLRGELRKLFARKRTYIGFGAFLGVELLVLGLFQLPGVQRSYRGLIERTGYPFDDYLSGLTLAFLILTSTNLLGFLYLALVAGDVVSKEVEDGTMRMMLCRPVARLRLLVTKYLACVIYTAVLFLFMGLTALAIGVARHGSGGLFAFAPLEGLFALHPPGDGLVRYLAGVPLFALSMLTITSLGFALSCFNMKPAAATIGTLSYIIVDFIFRSLPYFESLKPWFVTTHMATWLNVFQPRIPWPRMVEDYAYLLAVDLTVVVIGMIHFHQRDFKS